MSYWTCTFDHGTRQQRDPALASWVTGDGKAVAGVPVFQNMQKPLSSLCRVLTSGAVDELVDLPAPAKGHLQVGVINNYANTTKGWVVA